MTCPPHKGVTLTSPTRQVQVRVCRQCWRWQIDVDGETLAEGKLMQDLIAEMERLGERLDGSARVELLNLSLGTQQRGAARS